MMTETMHKKTQLAHAFQDAETRHEHGVPYTDNMKILEEQIARLLDGEDICDSEGYPANQHAIGKLRAELYRYSPQGVMRGHI